MQHFDLMIIGAGPAGLSAAIEGAKRGLNICVIEKYEHPRVKICGGGLIPRARNWLPIEISSIVEYQATRVEAIWHKNAVRIGGTSKPNWGVYMVMREKLDNLLFEEAKRMGVHFIQNTIVKNIEEENQKKIIYSTANSWSSDYLVIADGASGNAAKLLGWGRESFMAPAIEAEIKVTPSSVSRFNSARFDGDVIDDGYGWVFPKAHHLSIYSDPVKSCSCYNHQD
jgi:flavin-dependent dehydrogenase